MDSMPASSQNNQNFGKNNSNSRPESYVPRPGNAPENNNRQNFNIKIPPSGILDSSRAPLNSNGALSSDKNIKVDLNLNPAPVSGADYTKDNSEGIGSIPRSFPQPGEPAQNSSLPPQAPKSDSKNSNQYKLSNGEVQGPKPPLVPNKSNKLIFILVAGVAIGALAFGGYYLLQLRGGNVPVASVSPAATPLPTIDPTLDSDSDTIPDAVEKAIGTNPAKMDSDGDSFNDLAEIKNGYSPLFAGTSGKYTPEQLQAIKDKIKAANEGFYEREFGAPAGLPSPSPIVSLSPSPTISPAI